MRNITQCQQEFIFLFKSKIILLKKNMRPDVNPGLILQKVVLQTLKVIFKYLDLVHFVDTLHQHVLSELRTMQLTSFIITVTVNLFIFIVHFFELCTLDSFSQCFINRFFNYQVLFTQQTNDFLNESYSSIQITVYCEITKVTKPPYHIFVIFFAPSFSLNLQSIIKMNV